MVIRSAVFNFVSTRQRATRTRSSRSVQCGALVGEKWRTMVHDAARISTVAGGVSANATLAASGLLRSHGVRSSSAAAEIRRARCATQRGGVGQSHFAIHAGIGRSRWLRWGQAAQAHGIKLEVVKHTEAKRGFILLPRRWVVERRFAWAARFRRLARDYEGLTQTLAGFHYLAFACLMLHRIIPLVSSS